MTRVIKGLMALSLVGVAAACSGDADLRTAGVQDELAWLDTVTFAPQSNAVVSPLEAGLELEEAPAAVTQAAPKATSPQRTTTARRSTATRTSSTGVYSAPAPVRTERKENVARDAAIGAAGGAVIGAVAGGSRHRVKGAIIGGAVGAVAGAVIGKTIDVQQRPVKQYANNQ